MRDIFLAYKREMARQLYQLNTKLKVKLEKGVVVGLLTGLLQKILFIQMLGC